MSLELSVVTGLASVSMILGYFAFQCRESQEDFWQHMSVFLFFMSLMFLDLIMGALLLMVQNSAMTYLTDSVLVWGLYTMLIVTSIIVFGFLVWMVWGVISMIFGKLVGKDQERAKYDQ